jgi:hypothetical protein
MFSANRNPKSAIRHLTSYSNPIIIHSSSQSFYIEFPPTIFLFLLATRHFVTVNVITMSSIVHHTNKENSRARSLMASSSLSSSTVSSEKFIHFFTTMIGNVKTIPISIYYIYAPYPSTNLNTIRCLPFCLSVTFVFPQNIKSQPRRGGAEASAALKRNNRGYLLKEAPTVRT